MPQLIWRGQRRARAQAAPVLGERLGRCRTAAVAKRRAGKTKGRNPLEGSYRRIALGWRGLETLARNIGGCIA